MAEEKEGKPVGLLIGLMRFPNSEPAIGFDLMGNRIAFDIDSASLIFNQLGDILDSLGYFDEEDELPKDATCKIH